MADNSKLYDRYKKVGVNKDHYDILMDVYKELKRSHDINFILYFKTVIASCARLYKENTSSGYLSPNDYLRDKEILKRCVKSSYKQYKEGVKRLTFTYEIKEYINKIHQI